MRCNLVVSKVYGIALESIAKVNRFQRVSEVLAEYSTWNS